ncbi:MAG: sugar phosphate isomerase/epimerase family protein [Planctomycetota bacterium]
MKKGTCIGSLPGDTADEKLANAKRLGFDGVEVGTMTDPARREEHRAASEKHGVAVSSVMNSAHWEHPLSDPDPAVRAKSIEGVAASIETAAALGADTVLIVPAVVNPGVTYEEAWERSAESIREILPAAEEKNVILAVENVWNKFLLSPVEFAAYVDSFESEYVRAYFDAGNIVAYGYPDHWIRTLGARIVKVHVKGFDAGKHAFVQLLAGTVDWPAVMNALKDVGYDGYLTAEQGGEGKGPMKDIEKISSDLDSILAMG